MPKTEKQISFYAFVFSKFMNSSLVCTLSTAPVKS